MILNTREALKNKLGIMIDGVKSNASSSFLATDPLTPIQRSMIMRGVDKVYTTFTNDVAEGRSLSRRCSTSPADGSGRVRMRWASA